MRHPLQELQQLQAWRGRKTPDLTIARLVEVAADSATRTHKRLGELIELWQELMPPTVAARTVLTSLYRGVLQVKVDSAATAFEVDRLLRSGIEKELRSRYRGSLTRVKTRVDALDPEPTATEAKTAKFTFAANAARKKVGAKRARR